MLMKKCELCGKESETLNICQECGTEYCNDCGDNNRGLCQDCIDFKESVELGGAEEEMESDDEDSDL